MADPRNDVINRQAIDQKNRLKRREPKRLWAIIAWVFAGPLNPFALLLSLLILLNTPHILTDIYGILWLVSLPSAIAAAIGFVQIDKHSATNVGIIWLSTKSLLIIAGLAIAFFGTLALSVASPQILIYVIAITMMIGIPAALSGALIARFVLFELQPIDK